jgi:hypothetical protein
VQQVAEELGDVAQLVRLKAVNGGILLHERLIKERGILLIDEAKALRREVVAQVESESILDNRSSGFSVSA